MRLRTFIGVLVVALAGCGSSGTHGSGGSGSGASGETAKAAKQIVADASAALRGTHGYVIHVQGVQRGGPVMLNVVRDASGAVRLTEALGPATADIIVLPSAAYLRANRAFFEARGAPPGLPPDRWLEIPATAIGQLTSQLGQFSPERLGGCLGHEHGTLSKEGTTTVNGQEAVVVKDAGDRPGTQPGSLAVATSSPHYPLELKVTGHRRPGGTRNGCNNGTSAGILGTLTLSQFDQVPPIGAPAHPIRLG